MDLASTIVFYIDAELEMDADRVDEDGETILHIASRNGNTERVRFILREFANKNLLVKLSHYKHTALHMAIYEGHTEVAEILIDAARHLPPPADDNDKSVTSFQAFLRQGDKDMDTALHAAVMEGNVSIVKLLVEADPSDTHIQNNDGKTPMYIAVEKGLNDIADIISTTCITPSLDGPHGSTVVCIKNLDQGKSPGGTLYKIMDRYALYVAAIEGDADAIHNLEMRANMLNRGEETILHGESQNKYAERVRVILREFAKKNLLATLTAEKQTALHLAAINGHTELAEILIDAARHLPTSFQAFLRKADKLLNTALHRAVMEGHPSIVKLLVEADPTDTHLQNDEGKTPMYIAVEKELNDNFDNVQSSKKNIVSDNHCMVDIISTTCKAPSLDGPDGSTVMRNTNLGQAKKEDRDVIGRIIESVKGVRDHQGKYGRDERLINFFNRTDQKKCMVLELAVEGNYLDVVKLIFEENPVYRLRKPRHRDLIGIKPLVYKAMDKEYNEMVNLLTETYERLIREANERRVQTNAALNLEFAIMSQLIHAISIRLEDFAMMVLHGWRRAKFEFVDNMGWTVLHHATYYEFNSILDYIVRVQQELEHPFSYQDMISTPFHVAAQKGYTSTVKLLLDKWPSTSQAYTAVDKNGQNILHLAALQSNKEIIQCSIKKCPEEYKKKFINEMDNNGDTPLHILILRGCFVPELLRYEGIDMTIKNKKRWTPADMLYFEDQIADDQVQIKIALDGIQTDGKIDIFSSSVLPSKRMRKDEILKKETQSKTHEKYAGMKEDPDAIASCFADAIAGDAISKAALKMKVDKVNELGETILHVESKKGDIDNVQFIVSSFAKKNLLDKLDRSNQTALHLAAQHGHTQVVEALVHAAKKLFCSANDDANIPVSSFQNFVRQANVPDKNTTLHLAVLNNNVAIVKLLVEADPYDDHVQNNVGKTPIYIASENGYKDIVREICSTCNALSIDGPDGTTALHALIQNIGPVTEGESDVIGMMVHAAKRWSSEQNASAVDFEEIFRRTDKSGRTVLQLAVERNDVDAVRLILKEDPANQLGRDIKRNGLMRLISNAIDNGYSDDIIKSLSETYKAGITDPDYKEALALILAIQKLDKDSVLSLLRKAKKLVSFTEDNGWTPLHYAVYCEFDSILDAIIKAQKEVGYSFVYRNMESTPFYVAVRHGYTSTLVRLLESWPALSSAAESPYTIVTEDGKNILHLAAAADAAENKKAFADNADTRKAAADNRKEMVQGILKYCPKKYKDMILKQQDCNGNTPLHLLFWHGCSIPELTKHQGLDTMRKNKKEFTPLDMLYVKDDIVADQVHIKIALDDVQNDQSILKLWDKKSEKKKDIWECNKTTPSKRRKKDVKFDVEKNKLKEKKHAERKKDRERYKMRTNTQILVTALITTVTFTVGFTMPGGLHQSGEADEGQVILSRKGAFNVFMVSDALALLMSTSSLFFYFLESMNEDLHQVSLLNASSTVLNILSIGTMMLTFIAGTYVVLSDTPVLAIAICITGSLFFSLILLWIIKIAYDRCVKKNKD
ncbi:uncharacterized protein LOC108208771 isoform X2 [Daucus carota subsp. sativus]|uniref:uncharacterized protein LOC108208771 isoform X2 n=1 Tax=Daucus carota subsp. sativus TaxID=79200 RepID=UPI003082F178